jgi:hypothetical protein
MKLKYYIVVVCTLAVLMPLVSCSSAYAQATDDDARMIAVKAALIYRLASFVTWPKDTFDEKKDPIHITILGNRNVFDEYDKTLKIGKHKIEVSFAAAPADIKESHVIYVDSSQSDAYFSEFPETKEGVFTIGDAGDFAEAGGVIQILIKNGKPVLKVNVNATSRSKISIDSQVLDISEIYREPK